MPKPSREVNGSGRVLYHIWRSEEDYATPISGWRERPMRRVEGKLEEGTISEWAPSGNYLRIDGRWYSCADVEIVEMLPGREKDRDKSRAGEG
jgi:hypothetical protein